MLSVSLYFQRRIKMRKGILQKHTVLIKSVRITLNINSQYIYHPNFGVVNDFHLSLTLNISPNLHLIVSPSDSIKIKVSVT